MARGSRKKKRAPEAVALMEEEPVDDLEHEPLARRVAAPGAAPAAVAAAPAGGLARAPPRDSAGPGIPVGDVADAEAGAAAAERRFSDTAVADARRDALRGGPATPPLSLAKAGGDLICLHWPVREEVWWCGLRVRKVGAMTIVYEWTDRDDAKRRLLLGPYAHFLCLHVLLLCAIAACVYGAVVPASWVAARALGLALAFLALAALAATALADPGVFPRYFTRARPDWTYSEYAHAFRPPGTIFCQECQILVEDYNHFCPWSGTAIGKGNERYFTAYLAAVVASLVFDLVVIALVLADEQ